METFAKKYFNMTTSELISEFNKCPIEEFERATIRCQLNAVYYLNDPEYNFIEDSKEFIEDMGDFLDYERKNKILGAIELVEEVIKENQSVNHFEKCKSTNGLTRYVNSSKIEPRRK